MKTTQDSSIIDSNHHERTVILVCLLTLQGSPSSTVSFLLNPRQLSLLTYDKDKVQTAQKLFVVVRWKCRGDALVWNWFLFLGFLWWLSAHHHSFQSMRNNQSAVCISFLPEQYLEGNAHRRLQNETKNGNSMLQVIYRLLLSKFNYKPL